MRKVLFAFFLLSVLIGFAFADGFYMPSAKGNIRETHQLVAAEIDKEYADVRMYIALESDSNETVTFIVPLKYKPELFNVQEIELGTYKNKTNLPDVEKQILDKNKYNEIYSDILASTAGTYAGAVFAPILPFGASILYLGVFNLGASASFGVGGDQGLVERYGFSKGTVEIYELRNDTMDQLVEKYNLDPSVKTRFKEYGHMYLHVITVRPFYRKYDVYDLLNKSCKDPKGAFEYIAGSKKISYNDMYKYGCNLDYYGYISDYDMQNYNARLGRDKKTELSSDEMIDFMKSGRGISVEVLRKITQESKGIEIHYKTKIDNGTFWYPLGTGQFWDKPIGLTGIYLFLQDGLKIEKGEFDVYKYGNWDVYTREIYAENPDYDIQFEVREKGFYDQLGGNTKDSIASLFVFLSSPVKFVIPVLLILAGGCALVMRDDKVGWGKALKKTLKAWGIYLLSSVTVFLAYVAVIFVFVFGAQAIPYDNVMFRTFFGIVNMVVMFSFLGVPLIALGLVFLAQRRFFKKGEGAGFARVMIYSIGAGFVLNALYVTLLYMITQVYYSL